MLVYVTNIWFLQVDELQIAISEPEDIGWTACNFVEFAVCAVKKLTIATVYAYTIGDLFEPRKLNQLFFSPRRYINRGEFFDLF